MQILTPEELSEYRQGLVSELQSIMQGPEDISRNQIEEVIGVLLGEIMVLKCELNIVAMRF